MKSHENKEAHGRPWEILKGFQSVIITFFCYPIFILIGIIFVPYRIIIDLILKVKIGKKYGGLLVPQDAFFFREDKSKIYVTSVLIFKSKTEMDMLKLSRELLQRKVFDTPFYPKFTGTVGKFGGYLYLNKNTYELDECLRELEVPENVTFDEEYLKVLAATYANKEFPQNNTVLWEILCSKKPFYRNDLSDGYYYYPIIGKVHHGAGDGTSLMTFILNLFSEDPTDYSDIITKNVFNENEKNSFYHSLLLVLEQAKQATKDIMLAYFMGIGRLMLNELYIKDDNALHGPVLSGEKIAAWVAEDTVKFLPLAKKIKNRLGVKFTSVIITAITASLTNYFKRNSHPVPKSVSGLLAWIVEYPKLNKSGSSPLQNNAVGVCVDNLATNSSNSLFETVGRISEAYNGIENGDLMVSKFMLKYSAILPIHLLNKIVKFKNQTFAMSNVPGGAQVKVLDGCVLHKIIVVPMNFGETGVSIALLTYDNRFQLGVLIDKALVQSQKEVQRIADDMFYYITMLEEETSTLEKIKQQ